MGSPEASWATVTEDEFGGFRIVIPVTPKWWFRLFLPAWLCFWLVIPLMTLKSIVAREPKLASPWFYTLFLALWTHGGLLAALSIAWNWFGREVVVIDEGWMETRHHLFGFSRSRSFELSRIRGLRYVPSPYNPYSMSASNNWQQCGFGRGTIAIEYDGGPSIGTLTHRFGDQLPEDEAHRIIGTIYQRLKFTQEPDVKPLPIQHG
jgi:hypothetical protein